MTTVINPGQSTESSVENRSGQDIVSLSGSGAPAGGNNPAPTGATPIQSLSGYNIVLLSISTGNVAFILDDCDIGDVFEFHAIDPPEGISAIVWFPLGHTLDGSNVEDTPYPTIGTPTNSTHAVVAIRKLTSTSWVSLFRLP